MSEPCPHLKKLKSQRNQPITRPIKLTCRPNLLNSRPQRIGFYSKLEIPACIQGLTDFKLGARISKTLFLVVARRSSRVRAMSALKKTEISTKSTDYATIKLTCRPNLLNSRPQRIGFYSKLEIPACIQGLTDFKLGARVSKTLFLVVARRSKSRPSHVRT